MMLRKSVPTLKDPTCHSQAIKSDPRTGAADFAGLAEICIDLAGEAAKKAEALAATLIETETDAQRKDKYAAATEDIGEASKALKGGNGTGVSVSGLDGLNGGQDCRDLFEAPPNDPSDLAGLAGNLITRCGAIFFAARRI